MKNWTYYLTITLATAGLLAPTHAQDAAPAEEAPAEEAAAPTAETLPGTNAAAGIDSITLDPDIIWVSFIVDDGRVQSQRDYFGAMRKADMTGLQSGSLTGMVKVDQVFYYNPATRQFSRFDAAANDTVPLLQGTAYYRADTIMRVVPLNEVFVKSLAVQRFITVGG